MSSRRWASARIICLTRPPYEHMRSQSQARLIDRRMREDWEAAGSTDAYQRAHDKMIDILETYEPPKLSDEILQQVRSIVVEAEKELGVFRDDEEL